MQNSCAYAFKAIASFFVVMAHCMFPGNLGVYEKMIARFTVPLFFMYAGYFSAHKPNAYLAKMALTLLKLVLVVQLAHVAFYLMIEAARGNQWMSVLSNWFSPEAVRLWIALNRPPVGAHLWYLYALVFCYAIALALRRFHLMEKAYWLIPMLLAAQAVMDEGLAAFGIILINTYVRNFAVFGLPFFLLGNLIRNHQADILGRRWACSRNLCMLAVAGFAMLPLERRLSGGVCELYLGTTMASVCLVLLSLRYSRAFEGSWLATVGRRHSLFIYLFHYMMIDSLLLAADRLGLADRTAIQYAMPVLAIAMTIGMSYAFHALKAHAHKAPGVILRM